MHGPPTGIPLPLAVAVTGWLSGCGVPDSPRDLITLQDSTATVDILRNSATCSSCITVDPVVTLGDTTGPGYTTWSMYATIDDSGNYWVGQPREGVVKVWDAEGRFLTQVGRRGDGPLEFHRPAPVRTDADGRVHIVDLDTGRETVANADFSYASDKSLYPGFHLAVPLGEDERYLVNMYRRVAESVAVLHIVDGMDVIHSFGMPTGMDAPGNAHWVMAVDRQRRIYGAYPDDYLIQIWSERGRRILGLRGPRLNEREASPGLWSPNNPPRNQVRAMQVDDDQQLWVISEVLKDDWQDHMKERVMPNGRVAYGPTNDDMREIFESRIDLIDLTSSSLIATGRHEALPEAFVGEGLVLENVSSEQSHPQMVIWRLGSRP